MSRDPADQLCRAIRASFEGSAPVEIGETRSRDWWSCTFSGARHSIAFRVLGPAAARATDAFLQGLEDREFDLRGHFLAEIRVVSRYEDANGVSVSLEALTLVAD